VSSLRQIDLPRVPKLEACGWCCVRVRWARVGHLLPRPEEISDEPAEYEGRGWAFLLVASAMVASTLAGMEA